jgi:hypothetical protein
MAKASTVFNIVTIEKVRFACNEVCDDLLTAATRKYFIEPFIRELHFFSSFIIMMHSMKLFFALVLLVVYAAAFRLQSNINRASTMHMALKDHREELAKTAAAIAGPGKGYFRFNVSPSLLIFYSPL